MVFKCRACFFSSSPHWLGAAAIREFSLSPTGMWKWLNDRILISILSSNCFSGYADLFTLVWTLNSIFYLLNVNRLCNFYFIGTFSPIFLRKGTLRMAQGVSLLCIHSIFTIWPNMLWHIILTFSFLNHCQFLFQWLLIYLFNILIMTSRIAKKKQKMILINQVLPLKISSYLLGWSFLLCTWRKEGEGGQKRGRERRKWHLY